MFHPAFCYVTDHGTCAVQVEKAGVNKDEVLMSKISAG